MSLAIASHSRHVVGCQMPNFFSRIAVLSPRVSTESRKLFAIVSATVSTAGAAMLPSLLTCPACLVCQLEPVLLSEAVAILAPRLLLFPAPFAARAGFLGPKVKFLDVLGMHQNDARVVNYDSVDQH